ncbi:MAG: hypothetical protein Fur0037_07080 [Planctomycetota bacterium]
MSFGSSIPCPVCLKADFERAFEAVQHSFERCRGCGFTRMADPPSRDGLCGFYSEDRLSGEAAWQEHERNLVRFDGYLQWIERRARAGRFLDVGCSIGTSLLAAKRRGWSVLGLELSRPAAEFGSRSFGVEIRTETIDSAELEPGSFDAVWMHHTIEHVERPERVLERARDLLVGGGLLFQALPNHDSLKGRLLGPFFGYGVTVEHLSHFGRKTFTAMLRRLGFEIVAVRTRSYREDPRLLWDLACRLGKQDWLARRAGLQDASRMDQEAWIAFLSRSRTARFLSNRVWPARICGWLGLGEDLHVLARKA